MPVEILPRTPVEYAGFQMTSGGSSATFISELPVQKEIQRRKVRPLAKEIEYLRDNWKKEKLPNNWVDMPHVGFLLDYQIGFLDSDKLKDMTREERVNLWTETTDFSVRGFIREYLEGEESKDGKHRGKLVFLGELELVEVDGTWKLRDTKHGGNLFLEDTISEKERNGVPKYVRIGPVTEALAKGQWAAVPSPDGPTGIPLADGSELIYGEPYYEFLIPDQNSKKVYSYSIKTDFNRVEQWEAIKRLRKLAGQPDPGLTESSSIEDCIKSFAVLDPSVPFSKAIDVLRDTRFDLTNGSLYAFGDQMWNEIYKDISCNTESFWKYNKDIEWMNREFVESSKQDKWTKDERKEALSVHIHRLNFYVKNLINKDMLRNPLYSELDIENADSTVVFENRSVVTQYGVSDDVGYTSKARYTYATYGDAFEELQKTPGCAGGGIPEDQGGKTPYAASFDASYNALLAPGDRILECFCPKCDPNKTKEKVKAKIGNGKITCPRCEESAVYEC